MIKNTKLPAGHDSLGGPLAADNHEKLFYTITKDVYVYDMGKL